jgi:hypothetical protein
VFLHTVGSVGHLVLFGASGPQNVDALLFLLKWAWCGFYKKHTGTRYADPVFLHLVGYAGHFVHSSESKVRNIDTLFFMLRWIRCGLNKNRTRTRCVKLVIFASGGICGSCSTFLCLRAMKRRCTFPCLGGPDAVFIESASGHVTPNLCFCIRWVLRVT